MLKRNQLSVEIRINESTMAEEAINVNKDCDCGVSHRIGERSLRPFG